MSLRSAQESFTDDFGTWRTERSQGAFVRFSQLGMIGKHYINLFLNHVAGCFQDLQSLAFAQREMLELTDYYLPLYNTFKRTGRNVDYV